MQVLHQYIFFFAIVGSIIFFARSFSRLALTYGKNKWIFGFVGIGSFVGSIRLIKILVETLEFNPEKSPYIFAYSMLVLSFLIAYGVYHLLKRSWSKST